MALITLDVKEVVVVTCKTRTDAVCLVLAEKIPNMDYGDRFRLETARGSGVQWCRNVLGIEPRVVEICG